MNNSNKPGAEFFSVPNAKVSLKDIHEALKKLRELEKKHDYVDTDGNLRCDLRSGKKFCWKHGEYE